jgi:predicted PurR-regulated permease PerM
MAAEDPSAFENGGRLEGRAKSSVFDLVLLAGGLILFLVLLYEMHVPEAGGFLNPPLIAAAGAILLWPLRRQRAVRAMMLSGGFLLVLWFVDILSGVLLPFFFVYVLAYLFDPVVTYSWDRYRIPRWVSSFVVTTLVVGLVALIVLLLVPSIVSQLEDLATRILGSISYGHQWLMTSPLLDSLEETGVIQKQQFLDQVYSSVQEQLAALANSIPNAAEGLFRYLGSLLGLIMSVTVVPVLLFYTLKDYPYIKRRLVELFPTFSGRRDYLMHVGSVVGNYVRGQLTISAINAFNVAVLLMIFDIPFALLIGLIAGILNMVPNLGVILTNIIGILIAVVFGDPWWLDALIVFLVLAGESLLEQSVLTPKILSSQVGLHPVLILLSLFVFGFFLGIFGLLIAVPATALIMTFYKTYRDQMTLELASARVTGVHAPNPLATSTTQPSSAGFAPVRPGHEPGGDD